MSRIVIISIQINFKNNHLNMKRFAVIIVLSDCQSISSTGNPITNIMK